jgi:uncharacterized RmlC-like cupin family protein
VFADLFGRAVDDVQRFPVRFPPDGATGAHTHTADLAACLTEGSFLVLSGDELTDRDELGPGDFFLIPAGVAHDERVQGASPAELVVAYVDPFDTYDV